MGQTQPHSLPQSLWIHPKIIIAFNRIIGSRGTCKFLSHKEMQIDEFSAQ
jgi:hypothetical protein